jgi:protein subunit release factor A
METINIEIKGAEGGKDAKLLVGDMASVYTKACKKNGFTVETKN